MRQAKPRNPTPEDRTDYWKQESRAPGWSELKPKQRAFIVAQRRDNDAYRRHVCNVFGFWSVCSAKACRRARSCVGDPHACHERHSSEVPREMKVWLRAAVVALSQGRTPAEAVDVAYTELARFKELTSAYAKPAAQPPPP